MPPRRSPVQVPLLARLVGVILLGLCASCTSSTEIVDASDEAVATTSSETTVAAATSTTSDFAQPATGFEEPRGNQRPEPNSAEDHLCTALEDMLQSRLAFRSQIPVGQGNGPFVFEGQVRTAYYDMLNATEAARGVVDDEQPKVKFWQDLEDEFNVGSGSIASGFGAGFLLAEMQLRQSLFVSQPIPRNHATTGVLRTEVGQVTKIAWQLCPDIEESLLVAPMESVELLPGPSMRQEMMAMVSPRPEVVGGFCRQFEVLHTIRVGFRDSLAAVNATEPATMLDAVDFYERFFDFESLIEHDHEYSYELGISGDDARAVLPIEYSLAAVLEGDDGYPDDFLTGAIRSRSTYFINLAKRCPGLDHFALFALRDDDDLALKHALAELVAGDV